MGKYLELRRLLVWLPQEKWKRATQLLEGIYEDHNSRQPAQDSCPRPKATHSEELQRTEERSGCRHPWPEYTGIQARGTSTLRRGSMD
jgi:hypothetical protein